MTVKHAFLGPFYACAQCFEHGPYDAPTHSADGLSMVGEWPWCQACYEESYADTLPDCCKDKDGEVIPWDDLPDFIPAERQAREAAEARVRELEQEKQQECGLAYEQGRSDYEYSLSTKAHDIDEALDGAYCLGDDINPDGLPICRFIAWGDKGDPSVGMPPSGGFCLSDIQAGTLLDLLLQDKQAKEQAEAKLREAEIMLKSAEIDREKIEALFPGWRGFRDLVDCIEVTLHRLRAG